MGRCSVAVLLNFYSPLGSADFSHYACALGVVTVVYKRCLERSNSTIVHYYAGLASFAVYYVVYDLVYCIFTYVPYVICT